MLKIADIMFNTIVYQAPKYRAPPSRAGFGPALSPLGAASLVVALLALLFAAAIAGALQPAPSPTPCWPRSRAACDRRAGVTLGES